MSESTFKAIETQEEFDAAIKTRLDRNTRSVTDEVTKAVASKYEGWVSPEDAKKSADQIADLTRKLQDSEKSIADLTAKNTAAELGALRARIAHESGLPFELADRLSGATEEELRADAEKLSKFMGTGHTERHYSGENSGLSGVEKAFYERNPNLKGVN